MGYAPDGFSWPYQYAIAMGCIAYAWLGLILVRKILLRYFSDLVTAIVLGIIVLGTNYLNYVSFDGAMTHNGLFTIYALILYLTIRWHEQADWRIAGAIGLMIGLATIIRPTEIISGLIPLFWGITNRESLRTKIHLLWAHKWQVVILGAAAFIVAILQPIYWKIYSGHFFYYSYEDQGFDWLKPHILDGLFSFRKGWFIYTPIMIFAVLGFIPLLKRKTYFFWAIAIYFLINLYIVYSWSIWWYGGSFGARALVHSYAVLSLPLAAMVAFLLKRKVLAIISLTFMLLCVDLNLMMTWQAHARDGGWHSEAMTKAYYWKIFGTSRPKKADKKFLDVKRELKSTKGMTIRTLYANDFESDTTGSLTMAHAYSGKKAYLLNADNQYTPAYEVKVDQLTPKPGSWIRVKARVFFIQMQWNEWQMAQFVTQFVREGRRSPYTGVRIQRLTDPWQWHDLQYEVRIPTVDNKPEDLLKVYVWNSGSNTEVYVDDIVVELIEPED